MCGIAGILGRADANPGGGWQARAEAMAAALAHRGPDAAGAWSSPRAPVAFGHRRLAIIDLSPAGCQPMASADGSRVIAYNGELYGHEELRAAFPPGTAPRWRGHSDTEVMVEAIVQWGLAGAVPRFNGMFAFALWDESDRTVSLVRDRLGVKPLFLGRAGDGALLFASEMRGVAADARFPAELDRAALPSYFAYGYLPRTRCMYRDALAVAPGAILTLVADAAEVDWPALLAVAKSNPDGPFDLRGEGWHYRTYWSAADSWRRGRQTPFAGDLAEAVAEAEPLLADAVRRRMVSDVPLGALLSGGVDSSLVVALMQRQSVQRVRTFSIGFDDEVFDESGHAEAVARHLGTEHTTLRVGRDEALRVAGGIGRLLDEPLADSSFIPTYLVSELTRRHVTVAMTGDGGDEFFGGYWRYRDFRWLRGAYAVPRVLRRAADGLARRVEIQPPPGRGPRWLWYRAIRLLRLAAQDDFAEAYRYATTTTFPGRALLRTWEEREVARFRTPGGPTLDLAELMMHWDAVTVLPDDLLVKVDRASMAVSLECREPLLDYRLHEFSARLPLGFKLERAAGKRLLREVLYRHVPRTLVDRPKQGFSVPLQRWLRGDLRACVEQTLFDGGRSDELFHQAALRRAWQLHQAGRADQRGVIWRVFVLKQWLAHHRWN